MCLSFVNFVVKHVFRFSIWCLLKLLAEDTSIDIFKVSIHLETIIDHVTHLRTKMTIYSYTNTKQHDAKYLIHTYPLCLPLALIT